MLRSIEFVHQGRGYRGEVGPVPSGRGDLDVEAWFVSMEGGPICRVFEAHAQDADTFDFRRRVVMAIWLSEAYNRRVSGERRRRGARDPSLPDRRKSA